MFKFIESPMYENWFDKHYPNSSLIICSPYMKQAALEKLFDKYAIEERSGDLSIRVLIRGNLEEFTENRSSDVNVLNMFLGLSGFDISKFRRITNLHMKAYLIDYKYLLITSGNLTNSGIFATSGTENFEGGIATDDETIIEEFLKYFNHIWKQSEELKDFYAEIMDGYLAFAANEERNKKRLKKKSYKFGKDGALETPKYTLQDLPPAHVRTLKETVSVLYEHLGPLTMAKLGQELRRRQGFDDLGNDVNNRKYGEEKGNLAVFFGLCIRSFNGNFYEYKVSKLGKQYLTFDQDKRRAFLIQQMESKDAIVAMLERSDNETFDLRNYIFENYEGTQNTLQRKVGPAQSLIDLYKNEKQKNEL